MENLEYMVIIGIFAVVVIVLTIVNIIIAKKYRRAKELEVPDTVPPLEEKDIDFNTFIRKRRIKIQREIQSIEVQVAEQRKKYEELLLELEKLNATNI